MSSCNGNKKQVVFLGDSITEAGRTLKLGFLNLIEESIDANKFNIIGKGISGDKVSDLLVRYEEDVLAQNPDIVFMTNMKITIKMNDGRTVIITGDSGKYNKVTYDCFFATFMQNFRDGGSKSFGIHHYVFEAFSCLF